MNKVFFGDCRVTMKRLIAEGVKVQTCVTSPPYWGLRDYGSPPTVWGGDPHCKHDFSPSFQPGGNGSGKSYRRDRDAGITRGGLQPGVCHKCGAWCGSFGLEPTPELYVQHSVEVFRLVRDLLADDGTLWLNLGDTYSTGSNGSNGGGKSSLATTIDKYPNSKCGSANYKRPASLVLPSKNLVGIPWRVALALQADGWYLRSDIIWSKPNPMPESVTDRPTKSHEYLFLMSKNERYYYDNEAIKEPCADDTEARYERGRSDKHKWADGGPGNQTIAKSFDHMKKIGNKKRKSAGDKRNKRDVWVVPTQPFRGSHFATFPPALIEPCILAGSRPGDIVLDPFFGSGTTGQVAEQLGRQWIGCEIQRDYEPLQKKRTRQKGLVL